MFLSLFFLSFFFFSFFFFFFFFFFLLLLLLPMGFVWRSGADGWRRSPVGETAAESGRDERDGRDGRDGRGKRKRYTREPAPALPPVPGEHSDERDADAHFVFVLSYLAGYHGSCMLKISPSSSVDTLPELTPSGNLLLVPFRSVGYFFFLSFKHQIEDLLVVSNQIESNRPVGLLLSGDSPLPPPPTSLSLSLSLSISLNPSSTCSPAE